MTLRDRSKATMCRISLWFEVSPGWINGRNGVAAYIFLCCHWRHLSQKWVILHIGALISLNYWPKVGESLRSTDLIFLKPSLKKATYKLLIPISNKRGKLSITHLFGTLRPSLIKAVAYDAQIFAVEDELCWVELQLLVWTQYFLLPLCVIYWEEETQNMTKELFTKADANA